MPLTVAQRIATRIGTWAAVVAAVVLPLFMSTPKELPGLALGSSWILYSERALVLFAGFTLVLMALVRGGWQGSLPLKFSKDGFEWVEQVSASTEQAIDALQRQVDSLEHDLEDMSRLVVRRFEGGGRSG